METLLIVYYIFSTLAIVSSMYILSLLWRWGRFNNCFTTLLFWLHFSLMAEEITVMPYLFSGDTSLCVSTQFFHCYFGMMNIFIVVLLVEAHRSSLLNDPFKSRVLIQKYGKFLFLGLPCIALIPYMMEEKSWYSFSNDDTGWCALSAASSVTFQVVFFYMWVWIGLIVSTVIMLYTFIKVSQTDKFIGGQFFSTAGLLVLISILAWIPRSLERAPHTYSNQSHFKHHFVAFFPVCVCGVLFGVLFLLFEKRTIQSLQTLMQPDQPDDVFRMTFTWEAGDFDDDMGDEDGETTNDSITYMNTSQNAKKNVPDADIIRDSEKYSRGISMFQFVSSFSSRIRSSTDQKFPQTSIENPISHSSSSSNKKKAFDTNEEFV